MARLIHLAVLAALALPISPLAAQEHLSPTSAVPCTLETIHDGDTLKATVHLPFGVDLRHKSIRAWGYDAPEISRVRRAVKITADELVRGKQAKEALVGLLATGTLWIEEAPGPDIDPYDRLAARLWVKSKAGEWVDVADFMRKGGHTRDANPNPNAGTSDSRRGVRRHAAVPLRDRPKSIPARRRIP